MDRARAINKPCRRIPNAGTEDPPGGHDEKDRGRLTELSQYSVDGFENLDAVRRASRRGDACVIENGVGRGSSARGTASAIGKHEEMSVGDGEGAGPVLADSVGWDNSDRDIQVHAVPRLANVPPLSSGRTSKRRDRR
jgi:hypothetical protein